MSGPIEIVYSGADGRILVCDSVSYCDGRVGRHDVVVSGSYAGAEPIGHLALPWGPRAVIAHAGGVGKDESGITGLRLCQEFEIPAAAVETMSARISDGASCYAGVVGHVNKAASALGVHAGQPVADAARCMLHAPLGRPIDARALIDNTEYELLRTESGGIYGIWNLLLLHNGGPRTQDVFCSATHCGKVMAERTLPVAPKGVIANDAGFAKDNSGVSGLPTLADAGIAAAAVAGTSARIGDPRSTYNDGVISAVNRIAASRGIKEGMAAQEAALLLLQAEG